MTPERLKEIELHFDHAIDFPETEKIGRELMSALRRAYTAMEYVEVKLEGSAQAKLLIGEVSAHLYAVRLQEGRA